MRKLLISTTALSVALSPMGMVPGFAQTLADDGSVLGPDGVVLCVPTAELACDIEAITAALLEAEAATAAAVEAEAAAAEAAAAEAAAVEAAAVEAQQAEEAAAAAAAAEADSQAAADAAAAAEADAAAQAEAEAAAAAAAEAQAAADAAAAEAEAQAQAQVEAEAAAAAAEEEAAAAAAVQVEAEAAVTAVEQPAAEEPVAEEPVAEEPVVEEPVAEEPVAEEPVVEEPVVEEPMVEEPVAEEPVAEEPVAEEPVAEEPVAEEPVAEEPVAEEPVAEEPVAEEPVAEEPVAEEPVVEEPVAEEPVAEEPVAEEPVAEEPVAEEPAVEEPTAEEAAADAAAVALEAAEAEIEVNVDGEVVDPAAGLATAAEDPTVAETEPVDAPVVTEAEVETLTNLLTANPSELDPSQLGAAEALLEEPAPAEGTSLLDREVSANVVNSVTVELTDENVRTSGEEFAAAPVTLSEGKRNKLSDLEKAGLVVLGALTVGALIRASQPPADGGQVVNEGPVDGIGGGRVVSNTGDRVIVLQPDGTYRVLKDDDSIIRQPGSTVRTETYGDGSIRTIVERADGTQVVTIRDATGRVLRRAQYDRLGREMILIDEFAEEEIVYIEQLPTPRQRIVISSKDNDTALKRELAAVEAERIGRKFSLRQIRQIPEVRALAATIDVNNVTFASGSAAIPAAEARDLADLGRVMQDLLDENPAEIFLVEGHTDATGKAAMNLALSDRRAESVARALTEYFEIPPENMVIQGYGETELLVDTQASEARNRRVEVRVITPLMRTAALR